MENQQATSASGLKEKSYSYVVSLQCKYGRVSLNLIKMEALKAEYAVVSLQYELTPLKWQCPLSEFKTLAPHTSLTTTTVNIMRIKNHKKKLLSLCNSSSKLFPANS